MSRAVTARTPSTMDGGRLRRRAARRFIPPQHGAWAMLLVPYVAAVAVAGFRWPDAPLLGAWLAGYLLSYQVFLAVKARRWRRYRTPIVVYAGIAVPLGVLVVVARPAVLAVAPVYLALIAVNAWHARRRRERALLNDLASVAQSCLVMVVVALVAGVSPWRVAGPLAVTGLYLVGTVLFVKTMIRERDSTGYRRASIGYHLGALAAAGWVGLPVAAFFAVLLARAVALPGRRVPVRAVGVLEIVNSVLLLVAITLTWG